MEEGLRLSKLIKVFDSDKGTIITVDGFFMIGQTFSFGRLYIAFFHQAEERLGGGAHPAREHGGELEEETPGRHLGDGRAGDLDFNML